MSDVVTGSAALPAMPGHACQVFDADSIYVSMGVNSGDGLGTTDAVVIGDIYELEPAASAMRLLLTHPASGERPLVAEGSAVGQPGATVVTAARHILMSPDGDRVELLLLQIGREHYALPLSPMAMATEYTLLLTEAAPAATLLADLMSVSFARGTMITLASGRQVPIEQLRPGDPVLTRDHGPQPLRLAGHATLRAIGSFAPVVIPAGRLGNSGDLIVSQHHRMFLYQRRRVPGLATAELLVQARNLVDDENVFIREGGFVDWFSLVFDQHEIIYAEGIPAESLMVNDATVSRLPPEIAAEVKARFPGLAQVQHFGTEAGRHFLDALGSEKLFQSRHRRRPGSPAPLR